MSLIEKIVEAIVPIIEDRRTVRRYFGRRSIDKSCGEVVFDADPDGPISDETFKVVERIDARNFEGEQLAADRAAILADRYSAERAAQAALTAIMGEGDGVRQCDRDSAAEAFGSILSSLTAEHIRRGCYDEDIMVQAFYRHRSTAAATERARIVAWLRDRQRCWFEAADGYDGACDGAEASRLATEGSAYREAADAIERGKV